MIAEMSTAMYFMHGWCGRTDIGAIQKYSIFMRCWWKYTVYIYFYFIGV